jgi:hypothetical protein
MPVGKMSQIGVAAFTGLPNTGNVNALFIAGGLFRPDDPLKIV